MGLLSASPAWATLIDFESGFVDLQSVGVVNTGDNVVTFSHPNNSSLDLAIAKVGGDPVTGLGTSFTSASLPPDTPLDTLVSGDFFLDGASVGYIIDFANPVTSLSLDLYDFRGDGHPNFPIFGNVATLELFADAGRTLSLGTDSFTVPNSLLPDANIVSLAVFSTGPAIAASLLFATSDGGTGIDNIEFNTVPEPPPSRCSASQVSDSELRERN